MIALSLFSTPHSSFWKKQIPEKFLFTICAKVSLFHHYRHFYYNKQSISTWLFLWHYIQFKLGKHLAEKKQKAKLTLAKYCSLDSKWPKRVQNECSQSNHPTSSTISTASSSNTSHTANSNYQIYPWSKELDLSLFRQHQKLYLVV